MNKLPLKWQNIAWKWLWQACKVFNTEIASGRNHTQMLSFPKTVVLRKAKIQLRAKHSDSTMYEPVA
jgi:hypothetical protein